MSERDFWADFEKNATRWATAMRAGREQDVFHSLDTLLQSHDLPFCFDITTDGISSLLIFSPEGDSDVAAEIDRLVAASPDDTDWIILGRRPKKPLADASVIVRELYYIDPLQLRFGMRQVNDIRCIDMYLPEKSDLSPDESQGMLNTFMWHALGEGFVMDQRIQGCVHLTDTPPRSTISANELVAALGASE